MALCVPVIQVPFDYFLISFSRFPETYVQPLAEPSHIPISEAREHPGSQRYA